MEIAKNPSLKRKFIRLFSGLSQHGFDDRISFLDDQVGFSIKKTHKDRNEISLIKVALLHNEEGQYKVYIDVTFGELRNNAITIRNWDQINFKDPIDLQDSTVKLPFSATPCLFSCSPV